MHRLTRSLLCVIFSFSILVSAGCSTSAKFIVPDASELEINHRPVEINDNGMVKSRTFSYNAAKGVPYVLKRGGKEVASGKLETRWSFFKPIWAPFVFAKDEYDLTSASGKEDVEKSIAPKKKKKNKKG